MVTNQDITNVKGQILDVKNWLDKSAIGYLVKPLYAKGIGGFLFSTREDERLERRVDVTDYVSEDNSTFQSHMGIKPLTLTLRGFIGELEMDTDLSKYTDKGKLGALATKLTEVVTFLPELSVSGIQAKIDALNTGETVFDKMNNYAMAAENLASIFGITLPGTTKQERAFSALDAMCTSKQIMTVETPWGYFDNMAITLLTCEQDRTTTTMSDITVTLKQMKFVNTISRAATQDEIHALQTLGFVNSPDNTGVPITQANQLKLKKNTLLSNAFSAMSHL